MLHTAHGEIVKNGGFLISVLYGVDVILVIYKIEVFTGYYIVLVYSTLGCAHLGDSRRTAAITVSTHYEQSTSIGWSQY